MKIKLFIFLFLVISLIPGFLFAQFTQQGPKLIGTNAIGNSYQGSSVAISSDGNTAIIGGYLDNDSTGAVWVFTRSSGIWTQQGPKLVGTGAIGKSNQGLSVSISADGNTIIEGGWKDNSDTGAAWIFTRSGSVWTQQGQKLVGTGVKGVIGHIYQGSSVHISGDGNTAVLGAYADSNYAGAVWVFTRSGGVWTQQGHKLVGNDAHGNAYQGYAVSISSDGNTVIEGGFEDNSYTGAIWVFTRSSGVWTQQGPKLVGTGFTGFASQGAAVALSSDGNTFIEGGFGDPGGGSIWIFTRSSGVWTQQGPKLTGTGVIGGAYLGYAVAISPDGNSVVAGGFLDNSQAGATWIFTRSGGVWSQLGPKLVGTGAIGNARQGASVAISSEGTVIEGGLFDNTQQGAAWIFSDPTIGITPISSEIPNNFSLSQNYPNPFNPNSKIKFQIAKLSNAKLIVFDILGREVSTLVNEQLKPGTYEVDFDGGKLSSGVYYYKLVVGDAIGTKNTNSGGFTQTKKMILIK